MAAKQPRGAYADVTRLADDRLAIVSVKIYPYCVTVAVWQIQSRDIPREIHQDPIRQSNGLLTASDALFGFSVHFGFFGFRPTLGR